MIRVVSVCTLLGLILAVATGRSQQEGQVVVPAYQAGYSAQEDLLKQILQELKDQRQAKSGVPSFPGLLAARCASCHTEGKEERGGDFILIGKDGKLALSVNDLRKVKQKVSNGSMPPASPLGDGEKKVFADYVLKESK